MAMIENEVEKKVYKVEDVQNLLGLGRSKAYEFIENVYYDRKPSGVERSADLIVSPAILLIGG